MRSFTTIIFLITLSAIICAKEKGIEELWQITSPTLSSVQQQAVIDLIARILPKRENEFIVQINTELLDNDYKDKFSFVSVENKIKITATSGVAAANGFHYYLKYYAKSHISWSGDQLNVSSPLPPVPQPFNITIQDKFRYYENVCTVSYSMVWWDWKRWEREIDWMAMQAINFPLAFNGQELIWRKTFEMYGFTDAEIDDYFSGPAFLAWNRMGNFQGWSGPLSENWHKYQAILQTQILQRMRELGMIPVLPAFSGHVPKNITRVFPNANVSRLTDWGHFNQTYCCTTFLEPQDSRFELIGVTFLKEYINAFGTDHFYNTDLFNEMTPRSKEVGYLSDCGKAVYQSLAKADPKAIWVMQGWLFHNEPQFWQKEQAKALITSVPIGKLMILDLFSETYPVYDQLDGYFGQPFIWCMLHNFGGALGLYGAFNKINSDGLYGTRTNYSGMVGIGLTPEGIEQNDIIYEFMMETTWHTSPVDLNKWVDNYIQRRYGIVNNDLINAWRLLQESVYTDNIKIRNHGQYVFIKRPTLSLKSPLWYTPTSVYKAFMLFVNASSQSQLRNKPTFLYDLVDVTRQSLQLAFDEIYDKLVESYKNSNQTNFDTNAKLLLSILDDMDRVLATNEYFLLDKWIESARSLANTTQERLFNEFQARNQISIWGPEANIIDYATKQWSGMVSDYYKPRWQLFIQFLQKSLADKSPFNQTEFNSQVFHNVELKFVNQVNQSIISTPKGDTVAIASEIYNKYKNSHFQYNLSYYENRFYAGDAVWKEFY